MESRRWARLEVYEVELGRAARVTARPGGTARPGLGQLRRIARYLALGVAMFGSQVHGPHGAMAYLTADVPRRSSRSVDALH